MEEGVRKVISRFLGIEYIPERKPWKKREEGEVLVRILERERESSGGLSSDDSPIEKRAKPWLDEFAKVSSLQRIGQITYAYGPLPENERPDFAICFVSIDRKSITQLLKDVGASPYVPIILVCLLSDRKEKPSFKEEQMDAWYKRYGVIDITYAVDDGTHVQWDRKLSKDLITHRMPALRSMQISIVLVEDVYASRKADEELARIPAPTKRDPWKGKKPGDVCVRVLDDDGSEMSSSKEQQKVYLATLVSAFKKAGLGRVVYQYGPLPSDERPDFCIAFYLIGDRGRFDQEPIGRWLMYMGAVPEVPVFLLFVLGWNATSSIPFGEQFRQVWVTRCGVVRHRCLPKYRVGYTPEYNADAPEQPFAWRWLHSFVEDQKQYQGK